MSEKPPYYVPTMAEIEALPQNGLTVASTFSGGGGSCTGWRMAGFTVLWANEFEPHAIETYRANHPSTHLDTRDIRKVTGGDVLADVGQIDVLEGSPPCQAFSTAGQRTRQWGKSLAHADGTTQRSDDLFFEFARLVGELEPKAFVAENVEGIAGGAAIGLFKRIIAALSHEGAYVVRAKVLDAQWLGVPQARKRLFVIGLRADLAREPVFPKPLPYRYGIGDACPWLKEAAISVRQGGWTERGRRRRFASEPLGTVQASQHQNTVSDLWARCRDPKQSEFAPIATSTTRILRHSLERPAPTVTASGIGGGVRPEASVISNGEDIRDTETGETLRGRTALDGRRQLSIAEVRRLCSFPDDYVLSGNYAQRWARLGNSVPPLMARAVAESVAEVLK